MPTREQVRQNVAEFEREYRGSLSNRLQWWTRVLGIDRIRMFQLLGLSRVEARNTQWASLPEVVASHEEGAEIVDEMLGQLLASFDYDLKALSAALHSPVARGPKEKRQVTRGPNVVVELPYVPPPQARGGILLNEIVARGPSALPAMLAYLREGSTGNGRRGRRTD